MNPPEPSAQVAVGDVLFLNDMVTGFSTKKCLRWCIVTAVFGRHVRIAGRSTSRQDGVPIPKSAMDEFTKDGWTLRPPLRISLTAAEEGRNIGALPTHYLQQVLFFVDEEMP